MKPPRPKAVKLIWDTPNLPPESAGEKTYYLDDGDLQIHFDDDGTISSAIFESRENSPKERLDAVHKDWGDYVRSRTPHGEAND